MTKHERYRRKQVEAHRCPHCGKPCTPFYECEERRRKKRFGRELNRMVKAGILTSIRTPGKQTLYSAVSGAETSGLLCREVKDGDRRLFPRVGKKYVSIEDIAYAILTREGKPIHVKELQKRIYSVIEQMKFDNSIEGKGEGSGVRRIARISERKRTGTTLDYLWQDVAFNAERKDSES